jgi:hypothetical protein
MNAVLNPHRTGLVLGLFSAGLHALWSVLVATGLAQPLVDFFFRMHFVEPVFRIQSFELLRALVLVTMMAAILYATGVVLAVLWNALQR